MNIIPTPKKILPTLDQAERMSLQPTVAESAEFSLAVASFISYVKRMYNFTMDKKHEGTIKIIKNAQMEEEAYKIEIKENAVTIYVGDDMGANHAFATILQIMDTDGENIVLPAVTIEDVPDTLFRGLMMDLSRNRHDFKYLFAYVDMCYLNKMSVLHLHFTDDHSYTLPSELYPKLATEGCCYTREQINEIVEYAHARGVQIVPEIDVPGHCRSFGEAYGELFGTKGVICQHTDSMEAMKNLFRELCDMFPYSKYIHIGGDEAYTMEEWTRCPNCLEYAKSVGINTDMQDKRQLAELFYAHFISEMASVCLEKGRQPIAWEGFGKSVNDRISKDIWVMAWENYYQLTSDLLEAGFKVINCSWNPTYITPHINWSPEDIFNWSVYSWKAVHEESPILSTGYQSSSDAQVIGGQLVVWGDHYVEKFLNDENRVMEECKEIIERLPMTSENTWNAQKVTEYSVFEKATKELIKKEKPLFEFM